MARRARFTAEAAHRNLRVALPTPALSTDRAAMNAAARPCSSSPPDLPPATAEPVRQGWGGCRKRH
jgi:hypothetical protein